ncbi:MAG: type I phosphomannose isomerase catalytic subunit [Bacteroidales bacterium]|nr:mannose-6-phosphate isomerase [Bacteroidales bacterium]MDZ4204251.1 type I phosphomannose isomerase catalytic subunit [Bacteroidales bacterium]
MNQLYPLKFHPLFKEKIWGGSMIKTHLGLDFSPLPNCGEAWIMSGVENYQTVVSEGWLAGNELNELVRIFMDELVGVEVYEKHGEEFPLLIKLINSNDWLSLQVHPDDEFAKKTGIGSGKSEMWYVLQADKGAEIINGFKHKVDKDTFVSHLEAGSLDNILNTEKVTAGDVFHLPAGRVHALGPGILLAEIQQTSDNTFRISDWDRVDSQGNSRELHLTQALEVMNLEVYPDYRTHYKASIDKAIPLVSSPYFTTNLLQLSKPLSKNHGELDSFVIYLCISGAAEIHCANSTASLKAGECVLVPAIINKTIIIPTAEVHLLEVYIAVD